MDSNMAALLRAVGDVLGRCDLALTPETPITSVDDWDSLALANIILLLESQLGVVFDTYDVAGIKIVGDIIKMMEKAQN